ncbi:hypothetical protein, partial [Streptomyces anulatus]|uniref:hypothetical protein n=1 Tax=Streptomyces anulatus TaxID=1892 RepID=UPI0034262700
MKRVLTGVVTVTLTTLVTVTPAQAAPSDPVKALKSRFSAGKGVKFTEVTSFAEFSGSTPFLKRTGSLRSGGTGIAASDISAKYTPRSGQIFNSLSGMLGSERTIRIGTTSYYSGSMWAPPKGKTWVKVTNGLVGGISGWYGQRVNVAEPATLNALVTSGKRAGRTYSGRIGFGKLEKISPWFRAITPTKADRNVVVDFTLTLGPDRLPQRLVTSYPATVHFEKVVVDDALFSTETRFTGW